MDQMPAVGGGGIAGLTAAQRESATFRGRTTTGAFAVIEQDVMHPATMRALAAQRGNDLQADAASARRARSSQLAQEARRVRPVWHARAARSGLKQTVGTKPFCGPRTAARWRPQPCSVPAGLRPRRDGNDPQE